MSSTEQQQTAAAALGEGAWLGLLGLAAEEGRHHLRSCVETGEFLVVESRLWGRGIGRSLAPGARAPGVSASAARSGQRLEEAQSGSETRCGRRQGRLASTPRRGCRDATLLFVQAAPTWCLSANGRERALLRRVQPCCVSRAGNRGSSSGAGPVT